MVHTSRRRHHSYNFMLIPLCGRRIPRSERRYFRWKVSNLFVSDFVKSQRKAVTAFSSEIGPQRLGAGIQGKHNVRRVASRYTYLHRWHVVASHRCRYTTSRVNRPGRNPLLTAVQFNFYSLFYFANTLIELLFEITYCKCQLLKLTNPQYPMDNYFQKNLVATFLC